MTAPDEDYGRRERLLLHHQYPPTPPPGAGERYLPPPSPAQTLSDRYIPPPAPAPGDRYHAPTTPTPADRYISPPAPAPSDRYHAPTTPTTADRYISPPAPAPGDRYMPPPGERYLPSPSLPTDRFLPSASSVPADGFVSPPAPAPADRYCPPPSSVSGDRYLPSPSPAPGERYLPTPTPAPGERYLPSATTTTPGGPGDPYMRRDLGYHHHYRLPPPSYHPHYHQYHPHYHHHHHQRALPPAPHHRYHHVAPSPSRLRCCPSPSHYGPDAPYLLSGGSPGSGSSASSAASVATTSAAPSSASVSVSVGREYMTSPLLPHRGRTPPCSGGPARLLPPSSTPSSSSSSNQIIEYVGSSGGRHVSTPTPPPSVAPLPRCSSMSSCDVGIENPLCGGGEAKNHPPRRGCSGIIDKLDPGSTMSLCCGSGRRFVVPPQPPPVAGALSTESRPESRQAASTPSHTALPHTPHHSSAWRAVGQQHQAQASPSGAPQQLPLTPPPAATPPPPGSSAPPPPLTATVSTSTAPHQGGGGPSDILVQRSLSAPAQQHHSTASGSSVTDPYPSRPQPSGSGEAPTGTRPRLGRSLSTVEVKKFIKRETMVFFGVEKDKEEEQHARWVERRRRLACRRYGPLRDDYQTPRLYSIARQLQSTSAYASQQQPRDLHNSVVARPDILPAGRESADGGPQQATTPRWTEPPVRRKETVATMTFGGLAFVVATLTRHRPRRTSTSRQWTRSYHASAERGVPKETSLTDEEVFFDRPQPPTGAAPAVASQVPQEYAEGAGPSNEVLGDGGFQPQGRDQLLEHLPSVRESYTAKERTRSWQRSHQERGPETVSETGAEVGCSRIWSRVLDRVFDNSDRRTFGMGVVGRFFGRSVKRSVAENQEVKDQLDDFEDHRPFFTYWVTTVQVLILIISLACYGIGPIGFDLNHRSGQVLVTSLSLQQVDYQEPANFWIGPRAADLIHLGAKFAPCMRKDAKIIKEIEKGREKERETACCIRNDDSGCVQSSQADCSVRGLRPTQIISTWKKWSAGDSGPGGRISGSVCGLDPKFCEAPASIAPYEWPDDITKWPICRKTNSNPQRFRYKDKMAEHMVCEVIGHPCCIGIHGICRITTKEYCDFVHGYFHEEASLCSQVSCLDDVCGMVPFFSPELPDQFYRLWTSLFLHAGIFQLFFTLMIQYFLMRDLEKLTGSLRIMIIYMGSGVAGNLASAIFVPYRADVGPAGAQFGLLACLIVEVLHAWTILKYPEQALMKLIAITLVLFVLGLLPWVDNYAHLFGFIFGFFLSYALMPYVTFGPYDRQKKVALIWVCLLSAMVLFIALVVLFYVIPVYDCEVCGYFNCVPLTRDFCASQNINFKREEPVV